MQQTEPIKPTIEKIAKECEEAGASKWEALKIIKELSVEEKASEQKLKEKALAVLQSINSEAAKVFESFARMHVHTSKQLIEPFDRGNIVKSLLIETHANRAIALKIGSEVESKIKDLKISHLTTALVREMANAKLLEYGFEELHNKYSRLGMPVADIEKAISKSLFENKQILTEYNLNVNIPRELTECHFDASLEICALEDFATKPFACSIEASSEAKSIEEFLPRLLKQMNEKKKFFSLAMSVNEINFLLASALKDSREQKAKKSIDFFFDCLNANFAGEEKKPFFGLSLFASERFEKSSLKKKAIEIANLALARENNEINLFVAVDSKFCLKSLDEGVFEKEIVFLNCAQKELNCFNGELASNAQSLLGYIGLNLEKIAIENQGKQAAFEQELFESIEAAKKIIDFNKSELAKRKYLQEQGIEIEKSKPVLGLFRPFEAVAAFLEKKEFDKEAAAYFEKLLKRIADSVDGWIVSDFGECCNSKRFSSFNEKIRKTDLVLPKSLAVKNFSSNCVVESKEELEKALDAGAIIVKLKRKQTAQN